MHTPPTPRRGLNLSVPHWLKAPFIFFAVCALIAVATLNTGLSREALAEEQERTTRIPTRSVNRSRQVPSRFPKLRGNPKRRGTAISSPSSSTSGTRETDRKASYQDLKKTRAGRGCRPPPPNQNVSFDFEGEIKELVETISKITCRNFILTNKVRSQKFKIVSPTPVKARNAWRVFLAALEANDFTVVPTGNYWKIVQANDGTRSTIPFYREDESLQLLGESFRSSEQMVTKLYRVRHGGNTNNIVNYLNIFKSNRGQLHPFQGSNLIIMTDFAASLERLERILAELDQPELLERVHVVPVQFSSATSVAEKLTQVFEPKPPAARKAGQTKPTPKVVSKKNARGRIRKPEGGDRGGSVSKILADDRTNQLIIIASKDAFRQIMALKRKLDVPEDASDGQIHVLRLKHADAEELATTLSSLAAGRPTSRQNNNARNRGRGRNPPSAGNTSAALFQGDVKITADKPTNSLVITASKNDMVSLKRVIERLDVPRFQVFVEAAILEVSTQGTRELGVGWHGGFPVDLGNGETTPLIFANTPEANLSSLAAASNPAQFATLLGLASAFRGPTLDGTANLVQGGIPSVGVVLQALQTSNDVNVISTPHLLTMDNEEAEIQVNEKRPFPSGLSLGVGGLGNLAGQGDASSALGNLSGLGLGQVSFNREDIGLTLKIKPQINDEDYVRLEIDQELSDVAGQDQVTGQVVTSNRSAKTTVVVRSQDSVVIGGLVRDRETLSESKFPILGDIPLVGWLFKSQNRNVEKVNLIMILTPYIIRGPQDFRTIYERKMEERKEFVDIFYGRTKEYRAKIDWDRKVGPVAAYRRAIRREMMKAENEGPGLPDETVVKPDGTTEGTDVRGGRAIVPKPRTAPDSVEDFEDILPPADALDSRRRRRSRSTSRPDRR